MIPVVADADEAGRASELVVLSAMAHGGDPGRGAVLDVLVGALAFVETQHAVLYAELVLAALPSTARRHLEALMSTHTYEYLSEYALKFVAKGEAKGEAKAVLAVLEAQGVMVSEDARTRIGECRDLDQLDAWVRRAVTVDSIEDLFR